MTRPEVRLALRDAIEQIRETLPFKIDAWVLMPDHLHAIWALPEEDAAFGKRWGIIKSLVSRRCKHLLPTDLEGNESRMERRERAFWQRRFWEHQIRDDRDFERCMNYVHYNPVKHRLMKRVVNWPYSSFHRFVALDVYLNDWGVDPSMIGGNVGV